jgi:hypothetical protein
MSESTIFEAFVFIFLVALMLSLDHTSLHVLRKRSYLMKLPVYITFKKKKEATARLPFPS